MRAPQNSLIQKSDGHAVAKNLASTDLNKVNSHTNSNNGKSKSTKNLNSEHQRSGNQNTRFPESDHQKNQVAPHNKDVAKKQAKIKSEDINLHDEKKFEKIQSHDSSETTISYSHSSETKSSANTKKNDLLQKKKALDEEIYHLKKKQSTTENEGGREYENQGRKLEKIEEQIKSINEELGIENSYLNASSATEKLDSTKSKKNEETSSKNEFKEIAKAIKSIEDEIIKLEENNDGSENTESNIRELEKERDLLIGLMEKFTEIFEAEKYGNDSKKSDPPVDNKPKIKRTSAVPRSTDTERKVTRSELIDKPSDQRNYYQELYLRFNLSLKK